MQTSWRVLFTVLVASTSIARADGEPMDAALETSAGDPVQLKTLWKKPTVLFYEDRDSTKLNQHVKDALFQAGEQKGLLESVDVIAVANVARYNWFPARNFVLKAVRDVEKEFHLPVYLDFKGQLSAPPWSLPSKTSTVVVLSAAGVPVLTFKGRLSATEVQQVFEAIENQLLPRPQGGRGPG